MIHPSPPPRHRGSIYITWRRAIFFLLSFFQELLALNAKKDNEESAPLLNGVGHTSLATA